MARRSRSAHVTVAEYDEALGQLAQGAPPAIAVIYGGQEYFRRAAVEAVTAAVRRAQSGAETVSYQGPASTAESALPIATILDELTNRGLFSASKLVVVRHAQRFLFPDARGGGSGEEGEEAGKKAAPNRTDALADYVTSPVTGMYLLLECESLDRRTRLGKTLAEKAFLLPCPELRYERDTLAWLRSLVKRRGLVLTPQAAGLLFQVHGPDPGVLAGEVEKLALFVEGTGEIDGDAVRAFMSGSSALSFFELGNAVEERQVKKALEVARRMIRQGLTDAQGKRVRLEGTVHMAFGSLRNTLFTLWQAHDVAARGGGPEELEPLLGGRAWRAGEILAAGKRYSLAEIRAAFSALADGLAGLHDTGSDPALSLERVVLAICAPAARR